MSAAWQTIVAPWASWMVFVSWHAFVWGALALTVDLALGRRLWPQLRLGLWLLVAVRFVVPATVTSPVGLVAESISMAPNTSSTPLFCLWIFGVATLFFSMAWRQRRAWRQIGLLAAPADDRLLRHARQAASRLHLKHLPRLAWVPASFGAAVLGVLRPMVLLPRGLSNVELEHALLHEFAHLKRRDLWTQTLYRWLCLAYWFHPVAWVAARRAHRARELSCDQMVAACLGEEDACGYRRSLLSAAGRRMAPPVFGATSFGWRRSSILARLDALEFAGWRHRGRQRCGASVGLVLAAAFFLPAAHRLTPPSPWQKELEAARAQWEAARRKDPGYGSMHARYAAMRLQALTQKIAARRSDPR